MLRKIKSDHCTLDGGSKLGQIMVTDLQQSDDDECSDYESLDTVTMAKVAM